MLLMFIGLISYYESTPFFCFFNQKHFVLKILFVFPTEKRVKMKYEKANDSPIMDNNFENTDVNNFISSNRNAVSSLKLPKA